MSALLFEKLRAGLAVRIPTDYAAQGGAYPLIFPNHDETQALESFIRISWRAGETTGGGSFTQRSTRTRLIIYAQIITRSGLGSSSAMTEADIMADIFRNQVWNLQSQGQGAGAPGYPLDGANPVNTVITSRLRIFSPVVKIIGVDREHHRFQVNVETPAELTAKFGLPA
jgi:hypothetical protein